MDREMNKSVLRVMLDKMTKSELIESYINVIYIICDEDEQLKDITHTIICDIQANEVLAGRTKLSSFKEPHRKELFFGLLKEGLRGTHEGKELTEDVTATFYEDFEKSGRSFNEWWLETRR